MVPNLKTSLETKMLQQKKDAQDVYNLCVIGNYLVSNFTFLLLVTT